MTEAGWTAEPKEEGWHWWRKPSDGLTIPYVVKVQKASSGWFVLWQHDWNYAEVLGGEFLGPLSPTDRQQGRVACLGDVKRYVERQIKIGEDFIGGPDPNIQRRVALDEVIEYCDRQLAQAQDEKGVGDGKV